MSSWFEINELDPWQERIMKNFEEFNAYQTISQYRSDYISDEESSFSESESE